MAILVVEDDPGIRQGIADFLGFEGYAVDVAVNGEEALSYLRQRRPSLLVLDLVMPVMNGPQLLDRLRSERIAEGVPVAIMTAAMPGAEHPAGGRRLPLQALRPRGAAPGGRAPCRSSWGHRPRRHPVE